MAERDVETIRGAYDAFARGDIPAVLGILDAGVQWHEPGGGDSPSGTFTGPGAVGSEVFGAIQANFDEYAAERTEFSDEGDRVVVRGHFKGRNKGGAQLDTDFEHVFEMRDGKVVGFENKPDDAAAWAAGWGA
jgi:ketosteroid isomerase-like protein